MAASGRPSATSARTSASRAVSPAGWARVRGPHRARRRPAAGPQQGPGPGGRGGRAGRFEPVDGAAQRLLLPTAGQGERLLVRTAQGVPGLRGLRPSPGDLERERRGDG